MGNVGVIVEKIRRKYQHVPDKIKQLKDELFDIVYGRIQIISGELQEIISEEREEREEKENERHTIE